MSKKITLEEASKLVEFHQLPNGEWVVANVRGGVYGGVWGSVKGNVCGNVEGDVWGTVCGNVEGDVWGSVGGDVLNQEAEGGE